MEEKSRGRSDQCRARFRASFQGIVHWLPERRSRRTQLMRESQINVAYRWFLRLRLTDKMRTDSSTFSQNRRQQFRDSDIAQRLFDHLTQ